MKKCALGCSLDGPIVAFWLIRMGVVLLFLIPGVMKFMNPDMFLGMLEAKLGLFGVAKVIAYWAVVIVEIFGAILVAFGKFVPLVLYRLALLGFLVILLVATASVHWGNNMAMLSHFLMILNVLALLVTRPRSPFSEQ